MNEERQYERVLLRDPCAYCGGRSTELDHIEAASRGGPSNWENYAGVCSYCNAVKHTRSLLGMLAYELLRPFWAAQEEAIIAQRRGWAAV